MDVRIDSAGDRGDQQGPPGQRLMSPVWLWLQGLIVLFVLAGIVIAITKLV